MDRIRIRLSVVDLEDLRELLEDVREVVDPDLSLVQVVDAAGRRALERLGAGRLDPEALRRTMLEFLVDDVLLEREGELGEEPEDAALQDVIEEACRRYLRLTDAPGEETGRAFARAFVRQAIDDWQRYGALVFAERWL